MRRFYYFDKKQKRVIMGVGATEDYNCKPMEYLIGFKILSYMNGYYCKCDMEGKSDLKDNPFIEAAAPQMAINFVNEMLQKSSLDTRWQQLLSHEEWSKKEQVQLLKNMVLKPSDILWFCKQTQELGYLLDVYRIETTPKVYEGKKTPFVFREKDNGEIEKMGNTDMSDGEMRDWLKQRKAYVIYVFHKGDAWHCFDSTDKAIHGEEHGQVMGNQPHYHYLSSKWGICLEELNQRITSNKMPSSIHLPLNK